MIRKIIISKEMELIMDLEKYVIKKDKMDMLSSLKLVDKNLINETLEELDLDSINELSEYLIDEFEMVLNLSKDDMFTKMYFSRLVNNENSFIFSAYESDVESFYVFVYERDNHYAYYIPTEIRKIIKKVLGF